MTSTLNVTHCPHRPPISFAPLCIRGWIVVSGALPDGQFTRRVREFLEQVKADSPTDRLLVAYDFAADIHLLDFVLDGFRSPNAIVPSAYEVFDLGRLGGTHTVAVDDIFETQPAIRARRHHALIDARVNRDAYRAVVRLLRRQPPLTPNSSIDAPDHTL